MKYLDTNSHDIMGYFPTYDGDTSGPYYARFQLFKADDRRMMKLEKTQRRRQLVRDIAFCTLFTTALVLWLCSLL